MQLFEIRRSAAGDMPILLSMSLPYDRPHADGVESTTTGPPFTASLTALGRHPNTAIVCALERGPLRFNEVVAELTHVRETTVGTALRELDADGLVRRVVDAGPPLRVLYQLTACGIQLAPSLRALGDWAGRER